MSNSELHRLLDENETLRDRLKSVVQSPLSDSEKQQIIRDSQRLHSSAPASIALPNVSDMVVLYSNIPLNIYKSLIFQIMDMEGTPCVTPDWDKQSSSSEIAVACLQDKITQVCFCLLVFFSLQNVENLLYIVDIYQHPWDTDNKTNYRKGSSLVIQNSVSNV